MSAVIVAYLLAAFPFQILWVFVAHDNVNTKGESVISDCVVHSVNISELFDVTELSITYNFTLLSYQATDRSLISVSELSLCLNFAS